MTSTPQPADRMPSSVNQQQADLAATAATKEATQSPILAFLRQNRWLKDGINDDQLERLVAREVARATERLREKLLRSIEDVSLAIEILDGNAEPIKWREGGTELLRKLCEHLECYWQQEADLATLREERDELRKAMQAGHTNAYMALTSLEGLEIEAISRKRKTVPNFNEDSEWRNQVSAARLALDVAISALTRHEGREGQQKSDPVGTQAGGQKDAL